MRVSINEAELLHRQRTSSENQVRAPARDARRSLDTAGIAPRGTREPAASLQGNDALILEPGADGLVHIET
jgi:hypothetical protein